MSSSQLILVVEDNEANQMLARAVLELEGYEVRVVGSGPELFEALQECRPDLILMDVQLPGQDGLSLTGTLKADAATAAIPVVALTAHAMTPDRQLAISAGCAGYISKPINTRTLGSQVRQFLAPSVDDDRRLVAQ
ncbi:MAG TPA: response regulator [Candidatus Dormibacteraeota bacterium]|nr:response regulator [Candidatus Dormibacteraeota bacterium]